MDTTYTKLIQMKMEVEKLYDTNSVNRENSISEIKNILNELINEQTLSKNFKRNLPPRDTIFEPGPPKKKRFFKLSMITRN